MRRSPASRASLVAVLALMASLVAGCGSTATPRPTGSIPPALTDGSPGFSDDASTPPDESPDASDLPSQVPVAITGFTTPVPVAADAAWSSIAWRELDPADPLGSIRSVTRWTGGFVAVGAPVPSGTTARTPVWVSADGATWNPVDAAVFGPTTLVIGVEATAIGLVAMTVQGGPNDCGDETEPLFCWTPALPLQSWTSTDGSTWAAHPGPTIQLTPDCDDCGIDLPLIAVGKPGILVVGRPTTGLQLALTTDGVTWQILPASSFPDGFFPNDIAGFGAGFQAVGATTDDPSKAVAFSSADSKTWTQHLLAAADADPQTDTSADILVTGPAGVIAKGGTGAAPGLSLWWSTLDGEAWSEPAKYPPLGVWSGDGEGSGLIENGNLFGDAERMLAYRGGPKNAAWTSTDGRDWKLLQISADEPAMASDDPTVDLTVMPIGVIWLADDGTTWFGQPTH